MRKKRPEKVHKGRRDREKEGNEEAEDVEGATEPEQQPRKRPRKEGNEEVNGRQEQPKGEAEKETEEKKEERWITECQPHTPVLEKVRRINKRTREEYEEGGRTKPRPTGKKRKKLTQPTLDSFLSIRSGLKGSGDESRHEEKTSGAHNQKVKGKGVPKGPEEGSLQILGTGGRKPRVFEGSPEHNLMKEAGVVGGEGSHMSGAREAGKEESGSPRRKTQGWPPDSREGKVIKEGNGTGVSQICCCSEDESVVNVKSLVYLVICAIVIY